MTRGQKLRLCGDALAISVPVLWVAMAWLWYVAWIAPTLRIAAMVEASVSGTGLPAGVSPGAPAGAKAPEGDVGEALDVPFMRRPLPPIVWACFVVTALTFAGSWAFWAWLRGDYRARVQASERTRWAKWAWACGLHVLLGFPALGPTAYYLAFKRKKLCPEAPRRLSAEEKMREYLREIRARDSEW